MAIDELPTFPNSDFNASNGFTGLRRWVISPPDDPYVFAREMEEETWPGRTDVYPASIQIGAYDERLKIKGGTRDKLPEYNRTLVVIRYQRVARALEWPCSIPKPNHPEGTTMALSIHGAAQFANINPNRAYTRKDDGRPLAISTLESVRMLISVGEYHLICDRLKWNQIPANLDERLGTVNKERLVSKGGERGMWFLGRRAETLLVENYRLEHSYAAGTRREVSDRYKLTFILKHREIKSVGRHGEVRYYGWNHDFLPMPDDKKWDSGWYKILIKEKDGHHRPRYHVEDIHDLFTADPDCPGKDSSSSGGSNTCGLDEGPPCDEQDNPDCPTDGGPCIADAA